MGRRVSALLVLLGALFVGASVSGCAGECTASCAPTGKPAVGEVVDKDGDVATVRFDDGRVVPVSVHGPMRALHRGARYQFTLYTIDRDGNGTRESAASLGRDCGCGPSILNADGSTIDTAIHIPFMKFGVGFLGAFVVGIGAWALIRRLRHQPA